MKKKELTIQEWCNGIKSIKLYEWQGRISWGSRGLVSYARARRNLQVSTLWATNPQLA
jgi:hypothetical protein